MATLTGDHAALFGTDQYTIFEKLSVLEYGPGQDSGHNTSILDAEDASGRAFHTRELASRSSMETLSHSVFLVWERLWPRSRLRV